MAPMEGRGTGLVATRDIACGELIVAEAPVISFQDEGAEESVQRQFDALPLAAQREVMALHDQFTSAEEGKTLAGIVSSNCYACYSDSCDGVLFLTISRFNHSCNPNCEHIWVDAAGIEQVRASTDIRAGEELCVQYVDVIAPRPDRADLLWDECRLGCRCPACRPGDPASDDRRERMRQLQEDLEEHGPEDPARGRGMAVELLRLYDEEGLHLHSLRGQACYYAFELSVMLEDEEGATRWLSQAHSHSLLCNGSDHAETLRLQQLLRGS